MVASHRLLIVASDKGIIPSDELLMKMAFTLLNAREPSQWRAVTDGLVKGLLKRDGLLQASANLARFATANNLLDEDPETRGIIITYSKPLVLELLRAIYARDIKLVLPEASLISPSDPKLSQLTCTDGSFLSNTIYVRHPTDPNFFIRLADFHSYLLQEKRSEFFRLAASLGAKEVRLVDSKEHIKGVHGGASFKEPTSHVGVEAKADASKQEKASFDLSASFTCAGLKPAIPNKLRWLGAEPLWQAMAEARIDHWVEKFRVSFTYSQDFNVNLSLVAKVAEMGLSTGGSFSEIQRIEQEYVVDFFPRNEYQL